MIDLKKLRTLAEAATPGPWVRFDNGYWSVIGQSTFSVVTQSRDEDGDAELITHEKGSFENASFIAAANPQAVLALLDRIEKLEKATTQAHNSCLCERFKTKGFDYSEEHPRMGKPGAGKRWLTPRDILKELDVEVTDGE